jgi:hypothetical protein
MKLSECKVKDNYNLQSVTFDFDFRTLKINKGFKWWGPRIGML